MTLNPFHGTGPFLCPVKKSSALDNETNRSGITVFS